MHGWVKRVDDLHRSGREYMETWYQIEAFNRHYNSMQQKRLSAFWRPGAVLRLFNVIALALHMVHLQGDHWLIMNQRNGTAVLDDSPEGSIFPEIAWQQPQALDVVTEGMAQCLSSWAADSKEVKLQHECALGLQIESADQLVSMRYCELRSASVVLDDCQTCPCPAFCSNSASNNTHEASE
jgi:hypothetical protein